MDDEIKDWMRHKNEQHEGIDWFGIAINVVAFLWLGFVVYKLFYAPHV